MSSRKRRHRARRLRRVREKGQDSSTSFAAATPLLGGCSRIRHTARLRVTSETGVDRRQCQKPTRRETDVETVVQLGSTHWEADSHREKGESELAAFQQHHSSQKRERCSSEKLRAQLRARLSFFGSSRAALLPTSTQCVSTGHSSKTGREQAPGLLLAALAKQKAVSTAGFS